MGPVVKSRIGQDPREYLTHVRGPALHEGVAVV